MHRESAHCIRVFSWNINGIRPFLPASDDTNTRITSFFKPISQSTTRISQQANGSCSSPLRAFLKRHHWPEVLFLQELKVNPLDKKTLTAMLSAINRPLGPGDMPTRETKYTFDANLPRDKFNARGFGGKLYGVGTLLREDFVNQHTATVRHADWDLEGRVTIVELQQPQETVVGFGPCHSDGESLGHGAFIRPLALINIYAVNGTSAPYRSPDTGQFAGTRHDHKLETHKRLRDECLELEKRGFGVVVAGDLNIARGRLDGHPNLRTYPRQHCVNRADFNAKFFGEEDIARAEAYDGDGVRADGECFDGVDVYRALRGKERRYTYHPRGGDDWGTSCDRVDLIIVSKSLFDAGSVVDTDVLDSPQERGTSDHVPLWVKLKINQGQVRL